jgi:hypothetical protein
MSNTLHSAMRLDAAMRSRRLHLEGRQAGDRRGEEAAAVTMEGDGMRKMSARPRASAQAAMHGARANLAQRFAYFARMAPVPRQA